jgi:hypothetical protein
VEDENGVTEDLAQVNSIWKQCGIQFQVEDYSTVLPSDYELSYRTRNYEDLDEIRETFQDSNHLLVVYTGPWDRSGSIGATGANAWTNLPGEQLYGSILESRVARFAPILAHELGHYLSLGHVSQAGALMQPIVSPHSDGLSDSECDAAHWAAAHFWTKMLRSVGSESSRE